MFKILLMEENSGIEEHIYNGLKADNYKYDVYLTGGHPRIILNDIKTVAPDLIILGPEETLSKVTEIQQEIKTEIPIIVILRQEVNTSKVLANGAKDALSISNGNVKILSDKIQKILN